MSTRLVTVAAATAGIVLATQSWAQTPPGAPQGAVQTAEPSSETPRTIVDLFKRLKNKNSSPATAPLTVQQPILIPPPGRTVAQPAPQAQKARPARSAKTTKPRRSQTTEKTAPSAPAPDPDAAWSADSPLPAALAVADTLAIAEIVRTDRLRADADIPESDDPATRRLDDAFGAIATLGGPDADVVPMTSSTPSAAGTGVMHLLSYAGPDPDDVAMEPADAAPAAPYSPPSDVLALIDKTAAENGVPADLARGLIAVLSSYNPRATGRAGEIGLMQLMPQTARAMGFEGNASELYDPQINLTYGMRYLAKAQELGGGGTCQTVHRYTAGHFAKSMTSASSRFCAKVQTAMRQ